MLTMNLLIDGKEARYRRRDPSWQGCFASQIQLLMRKSRMHIRQKSTDSFYELSGNSG